MDKNVDELVVLCDEKDQVLGTMLKEEVHGKETPLHRAFSVFLFRPSPKASERHVLVQRRAFGKKTWPGVWSNSCCGHPLPDETREDAVVRRVKYELGADIKDLEKVSDYRYRFERDGVVENEVCPVFVATVDGEVTPNPEEVAAVEWKEWDEFLAELENDTKNTWSEWCKEEAELVGQFVENNHR